MTPKEKAKELVDKYLPFGASYDYDVIDDKTIMTYDLGTSKQCALIAVDEIIEQYEFDVASDILNQRYMDKLNYWDAVKEELKKL